MDQRLGTRVPSQVVKDKLELLSGLILRRVGREMPPGNLRFVSINEHKDMRDRKTELLFYIDAPSESAFNSTRISAQTVRWDSSRNREAPKIDFSHSSFASARNV